MTAVLAWVAPATLLLIASVQILAVETLGLSRWKGGGFGMFSTVDSPGARFLRVHLLRSGARSIPVLVPADLREEALALRTMPIDAWASALAQSIADETWVHVEMRSAVGRYELMRGPAHRSFGAASGGGSDARGRPEVVDFEAFDFVRTAEASEVSSAGNIDGVQFERLQLEVLRYAFDPASPSLYAERILEVKATAERRP